MAGGSAGSAPRQIPEEFGGEEEAKVRQGGGGAVEGEEAGL